MLQMFSQEVSKGPFGNCGLDMQHYMTSYPALVSTALSLTVSSRLISAPYHQTQDLEKISNHLGSRAAQVTGERTFTDGPG